MTDIKATVLLLASVLTACSGSPVLGDLPPTSTGGDSTSASTSEGSTGGSTASSSSSTTASSSSGASTSVGSSTGRPPTSSGASSGGTTGRPGPTTCDIMGTIYDAGQPNLQSVCDVCDPAINNWTKLPDGARCGYDQHYGFCWNDVCDIDQCAIGGPQGSDAGYPTNSILSGAADPDAACMICDPSQSVSAWSVAPDGTACNGGGTCIDGGCVQGCYFDGGIRAWGTGGGDGPLCGVWASGVVAVGDPLPWDSCYECVAVDGGYDVAPTSLIGDPCDQFGDAGTCAEWDGRSPPQLTCCPDSWLTDAGTCGVPIPDGGGDYCETLPPC